jgi:hypothetical protein
LWPILQTDQGALRSTELDASGLASVDAVILLTPHTTIDYASIVRAAPLVIDTHSGLRPREAPNVVNVWVPQVPVLEPAI